MTRVASRVLLVSAVLMVSAAVQVSFGSAQAKFAYGDGVANFTHASGVFSTKGKITGVEKAIAQPGKRVGFREAHGVDFSFVVGPLKIMDAEGFSPGFLLDMDVSVLSLNSSAWEANAVSAAGSLLACELVAGSFCVPSEVTDDPLAQRKKSFAKRAGRAWIKRIKEFLPNKLWTALTALALLVVIQVLMRDTHRRTGRRRRSRRRRRSTSAYARPTL